MSKKEATGKTETDDERVARFEKALDEDDEREEAERQRNAKLFGIKALAESTRKIHGVQVAGLGIVRYGLLTSGEVAKLKLGIGDNEQRIYQIASAMLLKADKNLTQRDIDDLPYDAKALLVAALIKKLPSFLSAETSKIGLTRTLKPKKSG